MCLQGKKQADRKPRRAVKNATLHIENLIGLARTIEKALTH